MEFRRKFPLTRVNHPIFLWKNRDNFPGLLETHFTIRILIVTLVNKCYFRNSVPSPEDIQRYRISRNDFDDWCTQQVVGRKDSFATPRGPTSFPIKVNARNVATTGILPAAWEEESRDWKMMHRAAWNEGTFRYRRIMHIVVPTKHRGKFS